MSEDMPAKQPAHAVSDNDNNAPPLHYADPRHDGNGKEKTPMAVDEDDDDSDSSSDTDTTSSEDDEAEPLPSTDKEPSLPIEGDMIKGCPALLVPINDDWAPTARDLDAPQVLPRRTFGGRLRTMFSRSAGKPLKPLPPSFTRPVPAKSAATTTKADARQPTYSSFEAFYLPARHRKRLTDGFECRYPAAIMVDHDVSAIDWDRFIINLMVAAALHGWEHLVANLAPTPLIVLQAGYGNYWITTAIYGAFRKRHIPEVLALVETYQHRFFGPRGLDVFVASGTKRISGYYPGDRSYLDAPPVEIGVPLKSIRRSAKGKDKEDLRRLPKAERKALKRQRKTDRKLAKASNVAAGLPKKQHVREHRAQLFSTRTEAIEDEIQQGFEVRRKGKYRLVVQALDGSAPEPPANWIRKMEKQESKWGSSQPSAAANTAPEGMQAGDSLK